MLTLVVENQSHGTFADLRGKLVRRLAHDAPSYSRVGASGKPGAVQTAIAQLEQHLTTKDAAASRNAIRALIDSVVVHAGDSRGGKVRRLELHGDLYRMLEFTEEAGSSGAQKRKQPQAGGLGAGSVTPVVAGVGFEPTTFRL